MTQDKKLDWEQKINRLKSGYLGFKNNLVQKTYNPFGILFHALALLDPRDRMMILKRLLPFVDRAQPDTQAGAQVAKLISAMVPTAPVPESLPRLPAGCHPAHAFQPVRYILYIWLSSHC